MKVTIKFDTESENYEESDLLCSLGGTKLALCIIDIKDHIHNEIKYCSATVNKSEEYNTVVFTTLEAIEKSINEIITNNDIFDIINSVK